MDAPQEPPSLSSSRQKEDSLNNRETAIQNYLQKQINNSKSYFCRFYLRGCCLFSAQDCKFAHGVKDLKFERIDMEEFEQNPGSKNNNTEEATEEIEQPSLLLEMNYKGLYEHQFVLKEKKEITKTYTQAEINQDRKIRQNIREKFSRDIQQDFVSMLYAEYNTRALKRAFIVECFSRNNFKLLWKYILTKDFAYEAKSQSGSGTFIVRQLVGESFDAYMEDSIIRIIKDKDLLSQLPISPSVISKWYYQYIPSLDPFMPPHHIYLSSRKITTFEDYLDKLQNMESFRTKLALSCERTGEDMSSMILFSNSSSEMEELLAKIKSVLLETIEESEIGFVLYSTFENRVMERCAQRLQQFNNNMPQIKKMMTKMALEENILILNFDFDNYLFSPSKFQSVSFSQIQPNFIENSYVGYSPVASDLLAEQILPNIDVEKMKIFVPDRQSEEFLAAELDMQKLVLVDNEETLKLAKEHFTTVDTISVDLEGRLCKGGRLELIQCASKTMIFVFDVYKLAKKAKEGNNTDIAFYKDLTDFLKRMMEDSKKCKIFHDGRQDSVALHVFLNACVSNTFDLSAIHILIEYLDKYSKMSQVANNSQEEEHKTNNVKPNLSIVEDVKFPGLNDVLEQYNASHGPNRFKQIMKKRFSLSAEYFLQRPIDREFLIYSARDVEDLIEVKENMEKKLVEVLKRFGGEIDSRMVELLCKKICKIYSNYGCEHTD